MPDTPDTCGRKPNAQRKIKLWIQKYPDRVDEGLDYTIPGAIPRL